MESNLIQAEAPVAIVAEAPMTVNQFAEAVKRAATQIESGIMQVWQLGQRAVRMAYGGSEAATPFMMALLNNLPADAARQTYEWLRKAGINVNRPLAGSKMYWVSGVTAKIDGNEVEIITTKKPGEDGFGYAKEKALLYVKTTPPMAMERKEAKAKSVRVLEGMAYDRGVKAMEQTIKRLKKSDPQAAEALNDTFSTLSSLKSSFFDATGRKQSLDAAETALVTKLLQAIAAKDLDSATLDAILSGKVTKVEIEG